MTFDFERRTSARKPNKDRPEGAPAGREQGNYLDTPRQRVRMQVGSASTHSQHLGSPNESNHRRQAKGRKDSRAGEARQLLFGITEHEFLSFSQNRVPCNSEAHILVDSEVALTWQGIRRIWCMQRLNVLVAEFPTRRIIPEHRVIRSLPTIRNA